MQAVPLVELTRGESVESIHSGCVAVVNARGDLLYYAGDPHFMTFTRSALKPFQAMPFVQNKGMEYFNFGRPELALMCASHSGEPMHVDIVQSMLKRAGCDEHHLQCGCHPPIYLDVMGEKLDRGKDFNQLHHNCSGKHAGFLAYCKQHGLAVENYLQPQHPLQQSIRASVAHFAGMPSSELKPGTDGCSAPNYAMPLSRLALSCARLSHPVSDPTYGNVPQVLFEAMTMHPELVSGTGRNDLSLMKMAPGDWVAKAGAEGVQAVGIRSRGLGIAIKIADGNARGLHAATLAVLQQLGLLGGVQDASLMSVMHPVLRNCKGIATGELRTVFRLERT